MRSQFIDLSLEALKLTFRHLPRTRGSGDRQALALHRKEGLQRLEGRYHAPGLLSAFG